MLNQRLVKTIVGLGIVVMAVFSIGTALSTQPAVSRADDNHLAPLTWYFEHDHARLDGDNNVLSSGENATDMQFAPLDWYFAHDHAILDGDNNVLPQ